MVREVRIVVTFGDRIGRVQEGTKSLLEFWKCS